MNTAMFVNKLTDRGIQFEFMVGVGGWVVGRMHPPHTDVSERTTLDQWQVGTFVHEIGQLLQGLL
jgi:hypothetical protein